MICFITDEDFNARIVAGVRRRLVGVDVISSRDVGLSGAADPEILEWAAAEQRVLLTHDGSTMLGFAEERLRRGRSHAGVVKVPQNLAIGRAVDDLVLIAETVDPEEIRDRTTICRSEQSHGASSRGGCAGGAPR